MNLILQRESLLLGALLLHSSAMFIALGLSLDGGLEKVEIIQLVPVALGVISFGLATIYFRAFRPRTLKHVGKSLVALATPVAAGLGVGIVSDLVLGLQGLSRPEVVVLGLGGLLIAHLSVQGVIAGYLKFRSTTQCPPSIVIAGDNARSADLLKRWRSDTLFPIEFKGYVDDRSGDSHSRNPDQTTLRYLGEVDDLEKTLLNEVVDEIWMTLPLRSQYDQVNRVVRTCELVGVPVRLSPSHMFEANGGELRRTDGHWADDLSFVAMPGKPWKLVVKRLIDVLGSLFLLICLSPVLILIAALIKLTSEGPVFFSQVRCGLHARTFRILKFRTMVVDADARKKELEEMNESSGPVFKMKKDPRITGIGAFLRKTSLDELPQLWNVLSGEMSLVGPRPPVPEEVVLYEPWQRRRLSVKPGITCTWQVSGRNHISFEKWMQMDLEYIRTWSLRKDIMLVLKTIPAVVFMRGAY